MCVPADWGCPSAVGTWKRRVRACSSSGSSGVGRGGRPRRANTSSIYARWRSVIAGDLPSNSRCAPFARPCVQQRDQYQNHTLQHNTYDVEFYGPNPLCGVYYLGALRAAEEMAKAALFLASADSSYCLGSEIVVDGGMTQLVSPA